MRPGSSAVSGLGPRAGNEDGATQTGRVSRPRPGVGVFARLRRALGHGGPGRARLPDIDGHVRPYHGRTLTLPKTHVPRRRLCMPATTEYWVNDANAEPLLFITAPANEGLLAMMTQELLRPDSTLAGDARRVTLLRPRGVEPRPSGRGPAGFDVIDLSEGQVPRLAATLLHGGDS